MKKNKGHARCNAFGLRHIHANESYDYVIVMDSDGEDRPIEIKDLISQISENPDLSVVAKRVKRSEGILFQTLYRIHKFLTLIFTGKKINFGNYCCLTSSDISLLHNDKSLWSSFSGTVKKNIKRYNEIESERGLRYFGPSKMSIFNLVIHSFSIIAVFKYYVFIRSAILMLLLSFFINYSEYLTIALQIILVIFNLSIFVISLRESKNDLLKSNENVLNEEMITH